MEIDVLKQMKEIAEAFDIQLSILQSGIEFTTELDNRIYKVLGIQRDFEYNLDTALELCEEDSLYIVRDMYGLYNLTFKHEDSFVKIGPFISEEAASLVPVIMEKNGISDIFEKELIELYNSYPLIQNMKALENLIAMEMRYLLGIEGDVARVHLKMTLDTKDVFDELRLLEENKVSMEVIEERYKIEDRLLKAVASGDYEKVLSVLSEFANYRISPRISNEIRNAQNSLIILNTLLRRAVQEAQVHPAHIDSLSAHFAKKIENTTRISELNGMSTEMSRKYCMLVYNYSLLGHSEMVRDALNYIDFNMQEDLTLNAIAERLCVNASYLSKQFKKENGKTLTDYVNEKRVQTSLKYLATTDLPIQEVAELVGILDENYYSRLFKKYQSMTPSKYRSMMRD